eukprot:9747258-Alexandrium_andersonii.AAC.1
MAPGGKSTARRSRAATTTRIEPGGRCDFAVRTVQAKGARSLLMLWGRRSDVESASGVECRVYKALGSGRRAKNGGRPNTHFACLVVRAIKSPRHAVAARHA